MHFLPKGPLKDFHFRLFEIPRPCTFTQKWPNMVDNSFSSTHPQDNCVRQVMMQVVQLMQVMHDLTVMMQVVMQAVQVMQILTIMMQVVNKLVMQMVQDIYRADSKWR